MEQFSLKHSNTREKLSERNRGPSNEGYKGLLNYRIFKTIQKINGNLFLSKVIRELIKLNFVRKSKTIRLREAVPI